MEGKCQAGDIFALASDALACWTLEQYEAGTPVAWDAFWSMSDEQFYECIRSLRNAENIHRDDTTLVLLRVIPESAVSAAAIATGAEACEPGLVAVEDAGMPAPQDAGQDERTAVVDIGPSDSVAAEPAQVEAREESGREAEPPVVGSPPEAADLTGEAQVVDQESAAATPDAATAEGASTATDAAEAAEAVPAPSSAEVTEPAPQTDTAGPDAEGPDAGHPTRSMGA